MSAIKHIVVPTDGSEGACKAAEFAGELARALDARVSVLFVQADAAIMPHAWGAGDFTATLPAAPMSVEEIRGMLERQAEEKDLPATVSALGALSQAASATVVWGHPADQICRFASESDADLIVIGSHGRTGISRAILGSVSHAVANQAPCPVTIVR